ncbi:5306_t:CDS:1, partial [Cetraspora pellucida]
LQSKSHWAQWINALNRCLQWMLSMMPLMDAFNGCSQWMFSI